jgi:hypothetical protein
VVEWTKSGLKIQGELEKMIIDIFKKEYTSLMRKVWLVSNSAVERSLISLLFRLDPFSAWAY